MQLGTSLVMKEGRHIRLTEAGERYFETITEEFERIVEATNRIRGYRAIEILNIRATPTLSTKWLMPRLVSFVEGHPDFDLRLDGTNEPTDFSRESVDIEIRHGEGKWPELNVEPLAEEEFFAVCSPKFAKPGALKPNELQNYRLIHSVKSQMQWKRWFGACGVDPENHWRKIFFDRSHMAIDAAVAGLGIALESNLMMQKELEEGLLISPVADPPVLKLRTQWLVCPGHHLRRRQVQVFLRWIREQRDLWQGKSCRPWNL